MKHTKLLAAVLALLLLLTACGDTTAPGTSSAPPAESSDAVSAPVESDTPTGGADTSAPENPVPQQPAHTHTYTDEVTAPTCTEGGFTTYTCACGDTYKDNETAAVGHKYTDKVVAPTCGVDGYTLHKCACGDQYKDTVVPTTLQHDYYAHDTVAPTQKKQGYTVFKCRNCGDSYKDNYVDKLPEQKLNAIQKEAMEYLLEDTPVGVGYKSGDCEPELYWGAHKTMEEHVFTVTVIEPRCETTGRTLHTCRLCGYEYMTDPKYPIGYHTYDIVEVVPPEGAWPGYTRHTCSVCHDSYNDNYVQTPFTPDGWKGEDWGSDEKVIGNRALAGQFVDHKDKTRKFYTSGMSVSDVERALNGYVGPVYGRRFFDDGISVNYAEVGSIAKIVQHSDGRLGVKVFEWRKSYASDGATNSALNMVMEAFYFFTGDRDVAYSLWSWIDAMNINGRANSDDFGFRDVTWSNSGGVITQNGINIEVDTSGAGDTFYFN